MTLSRTLPFFLALIATACARAETSPYYIGASQAFTHDSNLLRIADGQQAPSGLSKSDTVSTSSLLAGLDQQIGRQRVFGNFALRDNRLSNNDIYNNRSYALTAGADWETAERISGNVRAVANRNLAQFNTGQLGLVTKKNLETTKQLEGTARVGSVTAWSGEASAGWRKVDYTASEYLGREFSQRSASIGIRYRPSAVSNFGIALRGATGEYPHFFPTAQGDGQADRFDRRDVDFTAYLAPSGVSNIYAKLSVGRTRYDVSKERDFSGVTGLLRWDWRPTGKLHFDTRLTRDPGQDAYFLDGGITNGTVEYSRLTTSFRVRADYEVSAKISLNATGSISHRSLTQTLPTLFGTRAELTGSERENAFGFGGTWSPLRSTQLGCDVMRDQRRGDPPLSSNLTQTTIGCYGQFTLQL